MGTYMYPNFDNIALVLVAAAVAVAEHPNIGDDRTHCIVRGLKVRLSNHPCSC
jgi:hypothetical protein